MFTKQVRHHTSQLALLGLGAVITLWLVAAGTLLRAWAIGALGH